MGIFERYLSVWVGLCILLGVVLGNAAPEVFTALAAFEFARVNLVVAALIWIMIYPMMVQVDFGSIRDIRNRPKGLIITLVVNWLIKPFTMAALGWLFFRVFFADLVDLQTATEYIAGMILLGVAPCTAMVFVWSHLTKGDANYTLVQVSVNDLIMIFAFAPLVAIYLGVTEINVPWNTLIISVVLYVVVPLIFGYFIRQFILSNDDVRIISFNQNFKPIIILALLLTVVLLFGFQGEKIVESPFIIILIAIPLLIQTYGIFFIGYFISYIWKLPHQIAGPACLIGTSNFFELAVAVAIGLFGIESGAALATVVGVLVEVPVMLSLVYFVNKTRNNFPHS